MLIVELSLIIRKKKLRFINIYLQLINHTLNFMSQNKLLHFRFKMIFLQHKYIIAFL